MKFDLLAPALLLATPILGCLHIAGTLEWTQKAGYLNLWAGVNDNGQQVCDTAWGPWTFDHDGHPTIPCLGGYFYTTNGDTSWYGNNGGGSWTIANNAQNDGFIWKWDDWLFC